MDYRDNEPRRRPPQRRRRKKKTNILPAIVVGIIGVVIIALIIMGVKSLFDKPKTETTPNSDVSSILELIPTPPAPTAEPDAAATPTPPPTPAKEADITDKEVQDLDTMVIVGDSAYEYYKFDNELAKKYIEAINKGAASAKGKAEVYNVILPSAVDVMLPLTFLNDYAAQTSDQKKAIDYVQKSLTEDIKKVPLYDAFKAHCNEKLFFRTDNHVTALGGYYAYTQWAHTKGVTPKPLTEFEKSEYTDFLGNLFVRTENSAIGTAETIDIYKSKSDISLKYLDDNGDITDGSLYIDVTDYGSMYKYSTFLGGSHGYAEITNSSVTDNSACVIVIDSNGTPFAPFVAEHYNKTYVVDYRDYAKSVAALAADKGATDIIYFTSIVATAADSLIEGLNTVNG